MTTVLQRPPDEHRVEPAEATAPSDGFVARHRLLLIALVLVVLFHGSLLLAGSYQRTYDAYVHIFFADHYARSWFSGWDVRWYTGFSTLSYPPGSHQAVAAVSKLVGLQTGFALVQLGALLILTVGVYRWAAIWVDRDSAGWAAILLAISHPPPGPRPTIRSQRWLPRSPTSLRRRCGTSPINPTCAPRGPPRRRSARSSRMSRGCCARSIRALR